MQLSDEAQREDVMSGFGNNGGEEFLSYLQTGESMIINKDQSWQNWYENMSGRLLKIQNNDGSWQGQVDEALRHGLGPLADVEGHMNTAIEEMSTIAAQVSTWVSECRCLAASERTRTSRKCPGCSA